VLDTQGTGKFEITVGDALVHSKTQRGQGFLDSDEKRKAVFNAIRESAVNPTPLKVTVVEGLVDADGDLKNGEEEDLPEQSNTSLFFSLFTLVLSIPALIGA